MECLNQTSRTQENPKHETRNSKQIQNSNFQMFKTGTCGSNRRLSINSLKDVPKGLCFGHLYFGHLNLFRASCFEFRIFHFLPFTGKILIRRYYYLLSFFYLLGFSSTSTLILNFLFLYTYILQIGRIYV